MSGITNKERALWLDENDDLRNEFEDARERSHRQLTKAEWIGSHQTEIDRVIRKVTRDGIFVNAKNKIPWIPPAGEGFVWHSDFPPRFVRDKVSVGWYRCDGCGKEFKLWITDYRDWQKLPRAMHKDTVLCTPCFRKAVRS